jgi:membrane protein DedA with SNARE-associated domain
MFEILSSGTIAGLIHSYGLWALFIVLTLESMGLPLPGETALIGAALYAGSTREVGIVQVIAAATAGAIVGDNIGYLVGRSVGFTLLTRYGGHIGLDEDRLKVGEYLFRRHGGKIVFFGRFVAFLRTFAALLAGANRMAWPHFLLMNALGGLCWASLFGGGAYFLGHEIERVAGPASLVLLAIALVVVAGGFLFFRRHEKALEERARAALAQEEERRSS